MKPAIAFLMLVVVAAVTNAATGGDVSEYYGSSTWSCAAGKGWSFMIARSYCSYGAVDPNVKSTLAAAAAGGIAHRDIYHFPCMGQDAASQIQADINNVGLGNFGTLWLDIESNPSPGCGWPSDQKHGCKFLGELIHAAKAAGARVGVYASSYEWSITVGSDCEVGKDAPLWYADYDDSKSFGGFTKFGGWDKPAMKQYDDSVGGVCGINADADWYP